MKILTLNCWSTSIHFRLFRRDDFALLALGNVERVGLGDSYLVYIQPGRQKRSIYLDYCDHQDALSLILSELANSSHGVVEHIGEIAAVGHRVAHGGENFCNSSVIDEQTFTTIRDLQQLAPMHNTHNSAGIEAARRLLPDIPHIAVFDTAFHQTMPEQAFVYPLPYEWYQQYAVRRYGFHGHAHLYLSRRAAALLGKPHGQCNLVTIYLDRGVSICAIRNGVSIDTSMGLTPLEGAVMDTRCGDIDAGIISFEMNRGNLSAREMDGILNQKSGISGIVGRRIGRRALIQAALDGDERCALALKIESYRLKKYIGSYCAAAGPLDGVVFSHGSGSEDWYVRQLTLEGLEVFGLRLNREKNRKLPFSDQESDLSAPESSTRIFVIPSDEQLAFAEDVASILAAGNVDHASHAYSFSRPDFVPKVYTEASDRRHP